MSSAIFTCTRDSVALHIHTVITVKSVQVDHTKLHSDRFIPLTIIAQFSQLFFPLKQTTLHTATSITFYSSYVKF